MTNEQLEQLLYEEEGDALDFKRDQYQFAGASEDCKSELLKDILAFCNSWRRVTAYILIGVEEVQGGRSKPVGIATHLDDADLQQFVNSKTNRPINFSYQEQQVDGVPIGIIEIPLQKRPVFLTKSFGKLHENVVYVRRGSSTAEANPDEIASMAVADAGKFSTPPDLQFQFADIKNHLLLGRSVKIESLFLNPRIDPSLLKSAPKLYPYGFRLPEIGVNQNFNEDLVNYVADSVLLKPIGFAIRNRSSQTAFGVKVKIDIPRQNGLHIVDEANRPQKPSRQFSIPNIRPDLVTLAGVVRPEPEVEVHGDHFEITVSFAKVLPQETAWSTEEVFLGAEQSLEVQAIAKTYAENLPDPIETPIQIQIQTKVQPMELGKMQRLLDKYSD